MSIPLSLSLEQWKELVESALAMVEMLLLGVNVATGYISVKLCAWTTEDAMPDWAKLDFHLTESDEERLYG